MPYLTVTLSLSYQHKTTFYFPEENRVKVQSNDSAPNKVKQNCFFDDKKHKDFKDLSSGCWALSLKSWASSDLRMYLTPPSFHSCLIRIFSVSFRKITKMFNLKALNITTIFQSAAWYTERIEKLIFEINYHNVQLKIYHEAPRSIPVW